jgi:hypothetical protein
MEHATAIEAFLAAKAQLDEALAQLMAASEDHFDTDPDAVNWADAAQVQRIADEIENIRDMALGQGEYA